PPAKAGGNSKRLWYDYRRVSTRRRITYIHQLLAFIQ
ncbi:MAG: hypothetical protein ACI9NN_000970, partial [Bacteroidia bacterium]